MYNNNNNVKVVSPLKLSHIVKYLIIMAAILTAFALFSNVRTVTAVEVDYISGIAYIDDSETCNEAITNEAGQSPDFALIMTGDLEGCLYTFVETASCSKSGVYKETGMEIFVGDGSLGNDGTFSTTYQFIGKFDDCPNLGGQTWGKCHHPLVAHSGTKDYEGVRGYFDIKDDLAAGNYPYTGHLYFN